MTSGETSDETGEESARAVFTPSGLTGSVAVGTTVLDAARQLGVDLDSVCGGRAICGRCQVTPSVGRFPKWEIEFEDDHLSRWRSVESDYRGRRPIAEGDRLGCVATIVGDVVIDIPARSQLHKQVIAKDLELGPVEIDPLVTLHYLDLSNDRETDSDSDIGGTAIAERLQRALDSQWKMPQTVVAPEVLGHVHEATSTGLATVGVRDGTVVAIWPGFVDRALGMALDIGSTTLAGHLCDLGTGEVLASAGRMNPQIRFGEDLMSRVSYAMMHDEGAAAMTSAVRESIDELLGELLAALSHEQVKPLQRTQVVDLVAVGNPIMHHLLLGIDPTPLGQAPFPLATADPVDTTTSALDLDARFGRVHVAPCIAGHVGADTAAAILAEGPHRGDAIQLLVDVGTNAEIVLGNRHGLFAASSPTGPAFEGAQISSGQRATVGAIERVRIDRVTLEPCFKVIGSDLWRDGSGPHSGSDCDSDSSPHSGPVSATGICGSGIIEIIAELYLAGAIDEQGVIGADGVDRSDRIVPDGRTFAYQLTDSISLTQADVRAVQLAKAALRAGVDLLMEHANLDTVDEIRLAGAFGANIDPLRAMVLGLIPDCAIDRVRAVGNAAGAGAVRALLSRSQREEMAEVARSVTKIETATEPRFQDLFVAALAIPHLSAANPHLAGVVDLPERAAAGSQSRGRRRRRER